VGLWDARWGKCEKNPTFLCAGIQKSHNKVEPTKLMCAIVEVDMVESIGPRFLFLDALADRVRYHSCICFGSCNRCRPEDANNALDALERCLRLCASVVSLIGDSHHLCVGGLGGPCGPCTTLPGGAPPCQWWQRWGQQQRAHVWRMATALLALLPLLVEGGLRCTVVAIQDLVAVNSQWHHNVALGNR
jgi:hypothetical protein